MPILSTLRVLFHLITNTYDMDRYAELEYNKMRRLHEKGGFVNELRARRMYNELQQKYLLKIPLTAKIGTNFQIRHPQGIRIGRTTEIGDNCKVFPYFCTMAAVKDDNKLKGQRRHPKIGNDCMLGSRATVIGAITIGDDVSIGACAIVTKDIPSHSVVKGTNQIRPKRLEEVPEKYQEEYSKFLSETQK